MTVVTEDEVLDALSSVIEPENDEDIITLQMVSGLVIKDGNVGFTLEVDPSRGEAMEPVRQAAEEAVNKIPGVLSVTAVLTAHNAPQQSAPPQNGAGPSRGLVVHANWRAADGDDFEFFVQRPRVGTNWI